MVTKSKVTIVSTENNSLMLHGCNIINFQFIESIDERGAYYHRPNKVFPHIVCVIRIMQEWGYDYYEQGMLAYALNQFLISEFNIEEGGYGDPNYPFYVINNHNLSVSVDFENFKQCDIKLVMEAQERQDEIDSFLYTGNSFLTFQNNARTTP